MQGQPLHLLLVSQEQQTHLDASLSETPNYMLCVCVCVRWKEMDDVIDFVVDRILVSTHFVCFLWCFLLFDFFQYNRPSLIADRESSSCWGTRKSKQVEWRTNEAFDRQKEVSFKRHFIRRLAIRDDHEKTIQTIYTVDVDSIFQSGSVLVSSTHNNTQPEIVSSAGSMMMMMMVHVHTITF